MSVFGSRDDDPLLQDDPFAPPSNASSTSPSSEVPTDPDTDPPEAPSEGHSVFDDREKHRVICSKEQAVEGKLDKLNASLKQGWIFDCIEFRPASSSLVFVLQRSTSEV